MREIIDLLIFTRKASSSGLILYVGKLLKSRLLCFISFVFSPFLSIQFLLSKSKFDVVKAIENLGPIFIKFGQTLSTRPDIFGEEFISSIISLQDKLAPFDTHIAKEIIQKELNANIKEIFLEFNEDVVASASVAQVYKAKLLNEEVVAVKILRPNVKIKYEQDIKLLFTLARLAKKYIKKTQNLKLQETVRIFEHSMNFELNLLNEAASCSQLKDNLSKDTDVVLPKVYWDYSTDKVLVLEWIDGISIYDTESFNKYGIDKKQTLAKLAISFFNQAYRDGFFHADLHPGNILVTKKGEIAFLDFGIIGFLSDRDRLAMAELLYCLINRNYFRVAEIHQEIGFIPPEVNLHEFALACRAITEPIIGRPTNMVSIGFLLESLFKMTSEFGMQTQPQLIMLQKTIIVLEGIGQILAPDVNMWDLASPWAKKWASKNLGFDAKLLRILKSTIKEVSHKIKSA